MNWSDQNGLSSPALHEHTSDSDSTSKSATNSISSGSTGLGPTYRGGMVHFTAPETDAHILATPDDQPIAIDETAEVYALAAVIHLAWTGLSPTT